MSRSDPNPAVITTDYYPALSPRLHLRIRRSWAARGLDLDAIWRDVIPNLRGFAALPQPAIPTRHHTRASNSVFLYDQAIIWLEGLLFLAHQGAQMADLGLHEAQWKAFTQLGRRMQETLGAIRCLVLASYSTAALQLARSVSEDVDMLLVFLLRPKLAEKYLACRTPDEAKAFWQHHIAGGRAFRLVSEKLYAMGLDHTDNSPYGAWRREVLALMGACIHASPLSRPISGSPSESLTEQAMALDCLDFLIWRLHELCAWGHLLELRLETDLALIANRSGAQNATQAALLLYALQSRDILLDQLRWTVERSEDEMSPNAASQTP